jgi:hypothetical protein
MSFLRAQANWRYFSCLDINDIAIDLEQKIDSLPQYFSVFYSSDCYVWILILVILWFTIFLSSVDLEMYVQKSDNNTRNSFICMENFLVIIYLWDARDTSLSHNCEILEKCVYTKFITCSKGLLYNNVVISIKCKMLLLRPIPFQL